MPGVMRFLSEGTKERASLRHTRPAQRTLKAHENVLVRRSVQDRATRGNLRRHAEGAPSASLRKWIAKQNTSCVQGARRRKTCDFALNKKHMQPFSQGRPKHEVSLKHMRSFSQGILKHEGGS